MRVVLLCLLLLLLSTTTRAADPPNLVGLWGNETVSGPLLAGTLTVDGRQTPWQASMGGMSVPVVRDGDQLSFAMPGGQGHFRGQLVDGNIDGFWIQPPDLTLASAYATPVLLAHGHGQVWVGQVQPLIDRVTQYLNIRRKPDASLEAFLSNPEYNLGRGRAYDVHVDGDVVVLTDPKRKGWALNARFDEETDQLRVDWQGIAVFPFTRRDRDHASGYYVATPAGTQDTYRTPVPVDDGWTTAALGDVGMQVAPMAALLQHVQTLAAPEPGHPQVQGLLVARHGKLVFEAYFHGFSRDEAHDMRSAGKSFASLLVGMAIDHGAKLSAKTTVLSVFPQYDKLAHMDAAKRAITLGNLMSMNSGLACDDDNAESPGGEDKMQGQQGDKDWYRYTLNLPMVQKPGADKAVYCSAGINLLGGVVRQATGRRLTDMFRDWIARPMQMQGYHLNLMRDDDAYLAGGIRLRPRDMLKLGQLYLDGGVWHGQRLIDAAWIKASVARRTTFGPNHDYGYAWHLHHFSVQGHDYRVYAAEGNGGQFVIVVPELDLAVAITAGSYGEFSTWYPLQDLVTDYIIPAALPGSRIQAKITD
ncbi:CubicO group peptidase (beta-lactamase class C family) [Rhodanobacter sp. TND4EL1]